MRPNLLLQMMYFGAGDVTEAQAAAAATRKISLDTLMESGMTAREIAMYQQQQDWAEQQQQQFQQQQQVCHRTTLNNF